MVGLKLWNYWSDFKIISQKVFFAACNCLKEFPFVTFSCPENNFHCPFLPFSCLENNFETTQWNLIKLHTMVENSMRGSAVYKNHNSILANYRAIALSHFFLVQRNTLKLQDGIYKTSYNGRAQWQEVQFARTINLFDLITELLPFLTIFLFWE